MTTATSTTRDFSRPMSSGARKEVTQVRNIIRDKHLTLYIPLPAIEEGLYWLVEQFRKELAKGASRREAIEQILPRLARKVQDEAPRPATEEPAEAAPEQEATEEPAEELTPSDIIAAAAPMIDAQMDALERQRKPKGKAKGMNPKCEACANECKSKEEFIACPDFVKAKEERPTEKEMERISRSSTAFVRERGFPSNGTREAAGSHTSVAFDCSIKFSPCVGAML